MSEKIIILIVLDFVTPQCCYLKFKNCLKRNYIILKDLLQYNNLGQLASLSPLIS
jgi:hypothetical protein